MLQSVRRSGSLRSSLPHCVVVFVSSPVPLHPSLPSLTSLPPRRVSTVKPLHMVASSSRLRAGGSLATSMNLVVEYFLCTACRLALDAFLCSSTSCAAHGRR